MLSFKYGPGGIRTRDQRIMSPLRYRCATGPWRLNCLLNFQFLGLAGTVSALRQSSPLFRLRLAHLCLRFAQDAHGGFCYALQKKHKVNITKNIQYFNSFTFIDILAINYLQMFYNSG